MSVVKKYFKEQWQLRMCGLEYADPTEFYLSVWQTNRSATPLFVWRLFLFLSSLGIVLASTILYIQGGIYKYWFIYLTHWGLSINLLTTGFATLVSARSFFYGPNRTKHQLPWYVKTYWILYNIAAPLSFLITLFYWTVLFEAGLEEELNYGLDVAVHGLNSLVMLLLVATSAQPTRLLHAYQPVLFALLFFFFTLFYYLAGGADRELNSLVMLLLVATSAQPTRLLHAYQPVLVALLFFFFTLFYYLAGGVDRKQNPYVYPVLDWRHPGATIGVSVLTGVLLLLLYLCTIGLTLARDSLARKLVQPSVYAKEELPLRPQPTQTSV